LIFAHLGSKKAIVSHPSLDTAAVSGVQVNMLYRLSLF
jgi:hypothetical protein